MTTELADVPEAIYEALRGIAREKRTVFYSEIAPLAGVDTGSPHFAALVGQRLDAINRVEAENGRPLLSAVVIGKDSGMPGQGFFTCARDLRRYSGKDDLAYWLQELQQVYDYWSRH